MPTVRELSAPYENFMFAPRPGPGVCRRCFNLTDGYELCYACLRQPGVLDTIVPISYSVAHEQLHHALASYKRTTGEVAHRLAMQLAAVLWRFLDAHERCVARAARATRFSLVSTVPSSDPAREQRQPLQWIVSELVAATRERYVRLLRRSDAECGAHTFSAQKFVSDARLTGEAILLIDDTWTTGANAQSAAAALREAGAGPVAAVVIGRHVNRDWHANDQRLRALRTPFDWSRCAMCSRMAQSVKATAA